MPKQKKDKSDEKPSSIHYSGLSLVNKRTGEQYPFVQQWIKDLMNLTPGQKKISKNLSNYWIKRWLAKRIEREEVLKEIAKHKLSHSKEHGARVNLPEI